MFEQGQKREFGDLLWGDLAKLGLPEITENQVKRRKQNCVARFNPPGYGRGAELLLAYPGVSEIGEVRSGI